MTLWQRRPPEWRLAARCTPRYNVRMNFTPPRLSLTCPFAFFLLLIAGLANTDAGSEHADQKEFFAALKSFCGATFEGATEFPDDPKHPLGGKKLVLNVQPCSENEIRIPLRAGEDKSRTWIITLTREGLLLKHDHRHDDGTPDDVTMYGGFAVPGGSRLRQRFAADADHRADDPRRGDERLDDRTRP
jgi:hypothetical protein